MGPILLLVGASLLVPVTPVSDYRSYFESVRVPFYCVLIVLNIQTIPLLVLLYDLPLINPLLINTLIIASAPTAGLIFRKRLIDKALVRLWSVAVIVSMVTINDLDDAQALLLEELTD